MARIENNDKQRGTFWKRATAATLAVGMLAGGASGAYASGKDNHGGKDSIQVLPIKQALPAKGKVKANAGINLDFKDLNQQNWQWAYESIIRLASKQVFNGYEDGSFKPSNTIKRIEAIVAAVRLLGLKEEAEKPENMDATLNFKDFKQVQQKYSWAVGYLEVALENDLFSETETSVQAEKPADRLWAAILLVKALKLEDEAKAKMDTQLQFRDAKQIPAGAVGYVAVAVEKGLITGYGDNTFKPNKPVTRAELAALLDRADEQLPDQDAAAVTGTVEAISGTALTVKKPDGTIAALTLDANVFIFRKDAKVAPTALKAGDEVLIRTYQGNVVFIEVTKAAEDAVTVTDAGTVAAFTLNANGKIATISILKTVNGVLSTVLYNVSENVTITGGSGVLSPNANVVVTLTNNAVTSIAILS
ncbi:S-layer-like y domain-containing protein [Cohnella lubricantis]|uniref:S-layer homology domain-containing protein n=2 Tax=Cohnella lubricantis TaxID=2163172 RepID=A0A841TIP6_9BACL|nr:S-layer homology domain-containing protein [Cohnella lubricantis]MBB6679090.1 S-layer homology domain-containing protein [Cohnella lubricantis]MBP2118545.1 hypothetical protein [Cohnella lubricantis]